MKKTNQRFLNGMAVMLVLCMLISVFPTMTYAQNKSTETYDLTIRTERELINFIKSIDKGTNYSGKTIKLVNNIKIHANNVGDFNLLSEQREFSGVFDGGCHTISGIHAYDFVTSMGSSDGGLFGTITTSGVVKNLYLDDFSFLHKEDSVGVIAAENDGLIDNCRITGCKLDSGFKAAGIAVSNEGEIRNCTVEGAINGDSWDIAGIVCTNYQTVSNCAFVGTLDTTFVNDDANPAGIAGENKGTIQNCYSVIDNSVTSIGGELYGICQVNHQMLLNCYAADENINYAYKEDKGMVENINLYAKSDMTNSSFVKKMNSKLSGTFLKWSAGTSNDYPSLVDLNEVTFKSISSKKGIIKSNKSYAYKGQKVTLTTSIAKNFKLTKLTVKTSTGKRVQVKKAASGKYTFTMPDSKVVVTAKIVKKAK